MAMGHDPSGGAADWPAAFLADADKLDLPLLMSWFADEIDLRIGNMPPILGRAAAEATFLQFWSGLSGMSHRRDDVVVDDDRAIQGSIVTYTRSDGSAVSMPVASLLRRVAGGKLDRLWIYIDIAPLYAQDQP